MYYLYVLLRDLAVLTNINNIEQVAVMFCNCHLLKKLCFASPFLFTIYLLSVYLAINT